MSLRKTQSDILSQALINNKPFHSEGTWSFPQEQLTLFYKVAENVSKYLSFSNNASETDLQALATSCQPATFGVNQKDVLDESYRKAGKIDAADFAINLNIEGSGLLESVNQTLLGWDSNERSIRAELYKLNVYGPGSFFKAHKDTPRGDAMLGSLVIILPTTHAGGALHLCHGDVHVVHDCSNKSSPSDSVSWIAFYSDVEHEVSQVQRGYRVTLTYNLYFVDEQKKAFNGAPVTSSPLFDSFSKLLVDPEFLPNGGTLGFGLTHQYPVTQGDKTAFAKLSDHLKGADATLFAIVHQLGLDAKLKVVYDNEYNGTYITEYVLENFDYEVENMDLAFRECGGVKIGPGRWDRHEKPELVVDWVTKMSKTSFTNYFIAYGNEASLGHIYGSLNLLVTVGNKASRGM